MSKTRANLDPIDLRLLDALQRDAHLTAERLGETLNLSPSQAGRRRQRLESEGYITGYAARLDPGRLGLGVQAFVHVHMSTHGPDAAAGFLRLVVQWHSTFCINSIAHMIGKPTFNPDNTARDSWIVALFTWGEGYHSFHHKFQADYRNGHRWYHFDPTKWLVWTLSKLGATSGLRRTPSASIARARSAAGS